MTPGDAERVPAPAIGYTVRMPTRSAPQKKDSEDAITIVSGLPRSGTSLMMKMLEAGGLPLITDGLRPADADNPEGYFEFDPVKRLRQDAGWLAQARGKAVKVVSPLLRDLPPDYRYRVLFMRRDLAEIVASQRAMLVRSGRDPAGEPPDEVVMAKFRKHLEEIAAWLARQAHVRMLDVSYNALLTEPEPLVDRVNAFLGGHLSTDRMLAAIVPALYRHQRP